MLEFLNLVYAVCTWKSGRLNQIVNVPVPLIEKERVEANQLAHHERVEANHLVHHDVWRRINWYIMNVWRRIN